MLANNPYKQYQENSVFTATPAELVLMLYNGAIKFINQGMQYIRKKDYEKAHNAIVRVQDIINELSLSLDMKYEISNNFKMLYDYILRRLIEANTKKDVEILEEVLYLVTQFRDTWEEAMKIAKIQEAKQTSHT